MASTQDAATAGTPWQDRAAGLALAGLLPALAAGLLWRVPATPPSSPRPALQLVWIEPATRPLPSLPAEASVPQTAAPARAPVPAPVVVTPPADAPRAPLQVVEIPARAPTTVPGEPREPTGGNSLLEQVRRAALAGDAPPDFRQGLLENRRTAHDTVVDGRFAMRRQMSSKDVVEGLGMLLFGGNPDPCPEIRADVARHSVLGGNHERLREALRREQAGGCR